MNRATSTCRLWRTSLLQPLHSSALLPYSVHTRHTNLQPSRSLCWPSSRSQQRQHLAATSSSSSPEPPDPVDPVSPSILASYSETDSDAASQQQLAAAMQKLRALEAYTTELQKPDSELHLFTCALLIAKHAYPALDMGANFQQIEDIVAAVNQQVPDSRYPLKIVQTINKVLYQDFGFKGNKSGYYESDNSCINRVLERRTGIPITLSLLYMEVARRVGLPMVGVNLPAHFMIRPLGSDFEILVDPFNGGEVCYLRDAEDKLSELMGMQVKIDPQFIQKQEDVPPRTFLLRLLSNLKTIYLSAGQMDRALSVLRYMHATGPCRPEELRDQGLCLLALRRFSESLEALREYQQVVTDKDERARAQQLVQHVQNLIQEQGRGL